MWLVTCEKHLYGWWFSISVTCDIISVSDLWLASFQSRSSKTISNDQELVQSDPTSFPQTQKGNKWIHKLTAVYERLNRMNSSFPDRRSFSYLKFTKYVIYVIGEPSINTDSKNNIKSEMRSFKSNENIHKKEGGSNYVVSANKASSVTL